MFSARSVFFGVVPVFIGPILVAALISISSLGCGSSYSTPLPSSPTPPPPTPSGTAVSIPMAAASLGTRAYNPNPVTVASGTTVTWTNNDSIAHTSTSDASGWNSGTLAAGGSFAFTFQTKGTFTYHCAFHAGMMGTVIVQ